MTGPVSQMLDERLETAIRTPFARTQIGRPAIISDPGMVRVKSVFLLHVSKLCMFWVAGYPRAGIALDMIMTYLKDVPSVLTPIWLLGLRD